MRQFKLMVVLLFSILLLCSSQAWSLDRFVDLGDGTVLDTTSHLRWLKNASCSMPQDWNNAISLANNLASPTCGLNDSSVAGDWHLPTKDELNTIYSISDTPAVTLNLTFNNTVYPSGYWTSSTYESVYVWYAPMQLNNYWSYDVSTHSHYLWPVRNGQWFYQTLSVTPSSLNFGDVTTRTTSAGQIFSISNSSTVDNLVISNIALTGSDSGMFSLNSGTCGATQTLAPGVSCTVSVSFSPTSVGTKSTTLHINSNDAAMLNKDIALTGSGVAQVIQTFDPNVSWWRAENNANDSVGSNTGTLHGGTYAPGRVGQAFSFDGSTAQYVSVPHASSLDIFGNHSIAFWVKPNALPTAGTSYHLVSKWTNGYEYKKVSIDSDGKVSYFLFGTTASSGVTSATALTPGVWTHVVATYDGENMKIYLNGVQDASIAAAGDVGDGTGTLYLGYDPDTAPYLAGGEAYFNGLLDEVGWYNRTLSQTEVTSLNDGTPAAFGFTPQTGVPINTSIESSPATLTGFYLPAAITISGGEYALSSDNGATWGGWTSAQGTFSPDSQVKLRLTSAGTYGAQVAATVTIGGVSASFSATTIRFIDLGDGTVLDAVSSLRWLQNANCTASAGGIDKTAGTLNWADAQTWSNNLASSACGLSDGSVGGDWHLPTIDELRIFTDAGYRPDTLATAGFTNVQSNLYWSSSTNTDLPGYAWVVNMGSGFVGLGTMRYGAYVWPVRAGQYWAVGPLVTLGNGGFGNLAVGSASGGHQFTVKNAAASDQPVLGIALSGADSSQFGVTTGGSLPCASLTPTLAAGASCTVLVTAAPTSVGIKNASLTVTTAAGSTAVPLTATASYSAPTVTGISPSSGFADGGTTVTITGTGLSNATAVKFASTNATAFTTNSATLLTATSPAGLVGQTVDVTVTTPGGTSATSSADQFSYILQYQAQNQSTNPYTPYTTLAEAVSSASAGHEIRAYGGQFDGALSLVRDIILNGGYNMAFSAKDSLPTTLNGSLTVTGGTARVDSVTVKGVLTIGNGSLQASGLVVQ